MVRIRSSGLLEVVDWSLVSFLYRCRASVRDVGQGDLHGVTCSLGFVTLVRCCACAVVAWMRFISHTLDVAGCGAAGEHQSAS
jgi:hypothetical protein